MAHQEPAWEAPAPGTTKSGLHGLSAKMNFFHSAPSVKEEDGMVATDGISKLTLRDRFNNVMPSHRTYVGLRRRNFLIAVVVAFIVLLAIIIGVAVGVSRKNSGSSAPLPLPSNTATFTGDLTYYTPALGACGVDSKETELVCAVSRIIYDAASVSSNPNENPLCGKMLRIQRTDASGTTRSIDVKVVDRCEACKAQDVDLSPTGFNLLADEALGRVTGSWAWLP